MSPALGATRLGRRGRVKARRRIALVVSLALLSAAPGKAETKGELGEGSEIDPAIAAETEPATTVDPETSAETMLAARDALSNAADRAADDAAGAANTREALAATGAHISDAAGAGAEATVAAAATATIGTVRTTAIVVAGTLALEGTPEAFIGTFMPHGLDRRDYVDRQIPQIQRAMLHCYTNEVVRDQERAGLMMIRVYLASSGEIIRADLLQNRTGSESLGDCVARTLDGLHLDPVGRSNVSISLPVTFRVRED